MNYDTEILGVNNPLHPANEKELEQFDSTDLNECLEYYHDTGDISFLENAIYVDNKKKELVIKSLKELKDYVNATDNIFLFNLVNKITNNLK